MLPKQLDQVIALDVDVEELQPGQLRLLDDVVGLPAQDDFLESSGRHTRGAPFPRKE